MRQPAIAKQRETTPVQMAEAAGSLPEAPPRFFLLVGIPGSGKTTYARQHLPDALRVSLDDFRLMLTGVAFAAAHERYVVAAAHATLRTLLGRAQRWRRDVVLDATNVTRARRRFYVRLAQRHGLPAIAVWLACPLDLALVRNRERSAAVPEAVVRRFQAQLEPPRLEEGFAAIVVERPPTRLSP